MTTATISPAPVRRTLTLKTTPERAFEVFTAGFGTWWPKSHHTGKAALANAIIEPRVGGRWYEVDTEGDESEWGEVVAWEPPGRLVLAWRLNTQFTYDAAAYSEVEVRFTATPEGTRVDFEHRGLEGLGANAEELRAGIDGPGGWGAILQEFQTAAEA